MSSTVLSSFLARKRLASNQTERRQLEPICNALQAHQYKLAFRLCAKMYDKSPDHHIAKALRAICLFRLARYQEALTTCEQLAANKAALADADVLLFVSWIYSEVGRDQAVLDMLDEATRLHGDDEDVGIEAFCHFVRVGETKRMQQLALKMFKSLEQPRLASLSPLPKPNTPLSVPPPKYLYWCIMAIILQVLALPPLHPTANVLNSLGVRLLTSARNLIGAKEMAMGDSAQEFFIRTRLIAVRARGWKPPLPLGTAPPPTTSPLAPGSSDADYARAELLNAFVGPDGNKWCEKYLGLELWRREQEWEIGGENEWERGRGRCAKLLREGDTNWSTILYLIRFTLKLYRARRLRAAAKPVNGSGAQSHALNESSSSEGSEVSGDPESIDAHFDVASDSASVEPSRVATTTSIVGDTPLASPGPDMVTELLRWTYDRLYSLAHPPQERAAKAKTRKDNAKGKGKARAAEIESDSDEERQRLKAIPRRERGFLLGLLELVRLSRAEDIPLPSNNTATLPELIVDYLGSFGDKMCCFDDLRPYLAIMDQAELASVSQADLLYAGLRIFEENSSDALYYGINVAKVQRCLAQQRASQTTDSAPFLASYFAGLPLGKGLPDTDLQPADDYALLAADAELTAWSTSRSASHLEKLVVILEFALRRSKFKYQMRVLLIRVYLLLGAPTLAHAQYQALEPKQIQHDTLSHLLLTRASTFSLAPIGNASMLTEVAGSVRWYRTGEAEAADACVRTWSTSTFTKIEEYCEFRERLQHSLCKRLLQIEHVRMRLLQATLPVEELAASTELLDEIRASTGELWHDNRDKSVVASLQPLGDPSAETLTSLGPTPFTSWAYAFTTLYASLLSPTGTLPPMSSPPELCSPVKASLAHYTSNSPVGTDEELALFDFGRRLAAALNAATPADRATIDLVTDFFNAREDSLKTTLVSAAQLPWEAIHCAQIALEAYCLLEATLDARRSRPRTSGPAGRGKGQSASVNSTQKNSALLLDPARQSLRRIATTVSAEADQLKPGQAVARVASLSSFPLLDGFLDQTAMTLAAERKTFLGNLSRSIRARVQSQ